MFQIQPEVKSLIKKKKKNPHGYRKRKAENVHACMPKLRKHALHHNNGASHFKMRVIILTFSRLIREEERYF